MTSEPDLPAGPETTETLPARDGREARRGGRAPPAPPLGGVQEVHRLGLGTPAAGAAGALGRGRLGAAAPAEALRAVPRRAARRAGGPAARPQQRHRLPVPAALRLRPPHRPRHRPGAGRRPRARARSRTTGGGHDAVLFFRPRAERDSEEFYADSRYGELWVGVRPTPRGDRPRSPGSTARHLDELADALRKDVGDARSPSASSGTPTRPWSRSSTRRAGSSGGGRRGSRTPSSPRALSELRLIKDAYEIEQMRLAVAATARGSRTSCARCRRASGPGAASGSWRPPSTAGRGARATASATTRSPPPATTPAPCTGSATTARCDQATSCSSTRASRWTPSTPPTSPARCRSPARSPRPSARVYEVVLEAADAAFAVARPGRTFRELHEAAMKVIAARLLELGLLPGAHRRAGPRPGGPVPPPLDGARHEPPPRDRRPRLRPGAAGDVPRRRPGAGHGLHHRAGLYFRRTTCSRPRSSAASACGSRTTCWSPRTAARTSRPCSPARADDVEAWMARLR